MTTAHLAVQISIFVLATFAHSTRLYIDVVAQRGIVSRAASSWAFVGFALYIATFSLEIWRTTSTTTTTTTGPEVLAARRLLVPAGLWALKASVASLYVLLGVRCLVLWIVAVYLASSFLVVVAAHLALCRPWSAETATTYCHEKPEVAVYTALNVAGYVLVMGIPLACWKFLTHKPHVLCIQALAAALCAISITHGVLTLDAAQRTSQLLPDVLVNVELSLALFTTSLPSLWIYFQHGSGGIRPESTLSTTDTAKPPPGISEETRAIGLGFDPRSLGVLPDSISGSIRSDISTPRAMQEDWQAESMEALRAFSRCYSRDVATPPSMELWEMDLESRGGGGFTP